MALSTSGWSNGLMPMIAPATAVACSHSSICAPSGASTLTPPPGLGADVVEQPSGAERAEHLVGAAGGEVRGGRRLDDDGQHALAVLAGRLGDELLGPVSEPGVRGVGVAQDELVDAGEVGHADQGPQRAGRGCRRSPARGRRGSPRPRPAARRCRHPPARSAPGRKRSARRTGRPRSGRRGTPGSPPRWPTGRAASPGRSRPRSARGRRCRRRRTPSRTPGAGCRSRRCRRTWRRRRRRCARGRARGRRARSRGRRSRARRGRRRRRRRSPPGRATSRPCRTARPGSARRRAARRAAR